MTGTAPMAAPTQGMSPPHSPGTPDQKIPQSLNATVDASAADTQLPAVNQQLTMKQLKEKVWDWYIA